MPEQGKPSTMSKDGFRYEQMVEEALRGVVRKALSQVAEDGLPGEHHFYITFRTDHPDVEVPNHLRKRYPGEMTIVLEHQFWDLKTSDQGFEVTLSFSNVPSHLVVPFEAVIAFADPSVRFGLQFEAPEGLPDLPPSEEEVEGDEAPSDEENTSSGDKTEDSTKIVTLDSFRKK